MYARRSRSSYGRSSSSRFRSRPVARKQGFWVTTAIAASESNGAATYISLLTPSQWVVNTTTGLAEKVTPKLTLLALTATVDDVNQSRIYAVGIDDISTAQSDPGTVAFYANFRRISRWGTFVVANSSSAELPTSTGFFTNQDGIRRIKHRGIIRQDEEIWLVIQASTTGNLLTYGGLARTYCERG